MQLEEKKENLFNDLLDDRCIRVGVRDVIVEMIKDYQFTRDELIEMGFETIDIDSVQEFIED